jgi:hypothetical protein
MFDNQVDKITDEIDKILEHLEQMQPELKVVSILLLLQLFSPRKEALIASQQSGLVLSGGLGSSEYVQSKFTTCYDPRGIPILVDKAPEEPYAPSFTFVRQCSTYKFAAHSPSAKALSSIECSVSSTALQSFEPAAVGPLMAFCATRYTEKLSTKDEDLIKAPWTAENMLLDIFDGLSRKARGLKRTNLSSSI